MKKYRIEIVPEAEEQLRKYLAYILFVLNNEQAYKAVKNDYYETLERLSELAGIIRDPDEPELLERGLKKIFFERHDYVILFRLREGREPIAEIVKIFHTLEDYPNKI